MSDNNIEIGDFVNVYFDRLDAMIDMEVLYTPCATGDSFHLRDEDGKLYYVQNFNVMMRTERGD